MKTEPTEERAARALDQTLRADSRGPRTFLARQRVARALDLGKRPRSSDLSWLEHVASLCPICDSAPADVEALVPDDAGNPQPALVCRDCYAYETGEEVE